MILQDARHALNPVMTVGAQIAEASRAHHAVSAREARRRGLALLDSVRIADPERVWRAYAHELSGGLAQRAMIAMMLAPGPDLLVADEPTSALDVIAREMVLGVLDEQVRDRRMGLILISHDLAVVSRFCDRVLVMLEGRVVEEVAGAALEHARHPYTRRLLAARPRLAAGGAAP
jgi:peptide/nickel transport system ATP-binding protein